MMLFAAEAAVVAGAARVGFAIGAPPHGKIAWVTISCAVVLQVALYWADLYDVRIAANDSHAGTRLLFALGATFALAVPVTLAAPAWVRTAVPFALASAAVASAALRALAPWEPLRRRLLIVGGGVVLDSTLHEARRSEDIVLAVERDAQVALVARAREVG